MNFVSIGIIYPINMGLACISGGDLAEFYNN